MSRPCHSCEEELPRGECPKSTRECGHHCNHSWSQDTCHWCGVTFGEDGVETPALESPVTAGNGFGVGTMWTKWTLVPV